MMKSAALLVQGERANRARVFCDPPCESLPAHLRDCLAGMARLPSAEIDLVVTSPSYDLNIKYGQYSDRQGFVPYETIQSRMKERPHPATFPIQLAEWCVQLHGCARVEKMLDPFLGIGNSALAAQRCDVRKFIGFEIDPEYLAEAKRRLDARACKT